VAGYFLLGNPDVGIKGGPISTLVCFGLIAVLDLVIIKLTLPKTLSYFRVFIKPLAAAGVMGLAAWAVYGIASRFFLSPVDNGTMAISGLGNAVALVLAMGIGTGIYFILILFTKAISKEDLALMPKGDKLAKLLRIR